MNARRRAIKTPHPRGHAAAPRGIKFLIRPSGFPLARYRLLPAAQQS